MATQPKPQTQTQSSEPETITAPPPPDATSTSTAPLSPVAGDTPTEVMFQVDRDRSVRARVLRQHQDGSLDLEGVFAQPFFKKVKLRDEEGEPTGFTEDRLTEPKQVEVRLRVRRAEDDAIRVRRCAPGTWWPVEG